MAELPSTNRMTEPAVDAHGPGSAPTAPRGLDLDRLAGYLARHRPELAGAPLRARLIAGGKSNLTYLLQAGGQEVVLRRPPLGHVLATAHDMTREYRVISALAPTDVPVPEALLLCADPEVIGAPFYLMERVRGEVFRTRRPTRSPPASGGSWRWR
jgi:aminoglycoside phosphotransferase (APT) family kinase protein